MQPTGQPSQVNSNWGNPEIIQKFRSDALSKGMGLQTVDQYIQQMQQAYQTQSANAIQNKVGQTQGGLTPEQATANPVAASQFIGNGGQILNTGPGAQSQFINQAQKTLQQAKGKNKYVDPNTYNTLKANFVATGGSEADFDSKFTQYTDPNKIIDYNTPEGRANQEQYGQVKRQIQSRLDAYHSIPAAQKGFFSNSQIDNIPLLNALAPLVAPDAGVYDNNSNAFSAQLKGLAGAGQGSGVRANQTELDRWAGFLPRASDTATQVKDKLNQLNGAIKATYNIPQGLDSGYLPSGGRPPLASFGQ